MAEKKDRLVKEESRKNEIRVGQKRSEAYVKIAENLFLTNEEIILCGLGNTIKTVVSVAEILKHRKYAKLTKIDTSMIEGDNNRQSIAKIEIKVTRLPGVKELLEKIAEENKEETEYEKHLREQEDRDID